MRNNHFIDNMILNGIPIKVKDFNRWKNEILYDEILSDSIQLDKTLFNKIGNSISKFKRKKEQLRIRKFPKSLSS